MHFLTSISRRYLNHLFRFTPSVFSHIQIFQNLYGSPPIIRFSSKTLKNGSTPTSRVSNTCINEASKTFDSTIWNHKTVEEAIISYGNDWKRAFEFFNWIENECRFEHNIDTYNRMIDILGKFFEFDLAWSLIERIKMDEFCSPDHTTFRIMFKRYVSAHMVQEAIDTYNRAEAFNLKDEKCFSNLVDALCEYKHVIEAEELCMGKDSPIAINTKLYNMILRGWFKIGWWRKCRDFWEEMDRKGVVRDLHSYSIFMDIMCKSGKPWKTIKLYKEMKEKGIQLDVVAYNTVIHAVGLLDGVDESIRIYREMLDMGCSPTIVTYNTIIKLLCQSGRLRQAYSMIGQMRKKGCDPDAITYHCFFGCLNGPKEILKLFERMVERGIHPRMDTYVMLISKFGRWGFLRPVFIIWKKMEEHRCSPSEFAYNALIDALLQKGMVDMARKYDEEMLARGLSAKPRKELGTKFLGEGSHDVCI